MAMDAEHFRKLPLMGILRGVKKRDIKPLFEAVIEAGLETIEITMNTPGASELISEACKVSDGRITVGAGTVLSREELDIALDAGATFIVMPVCVDDVMRGCAERNIPVFPGAFTPTEVFNAARAGAAMVKVFPASMLGPKYIKELKAPFNDIKLIAVGGVRPGNAGEYFSNGANAVAFGASVFKREWLDAGDFASIGTLVKEFVEAVKVSASK